MRETTLLLKLRLYYVNNVRYEMRCSERWSADTASLKGVTRKLFRGCFFISVITFCLFFLHAFPFFLPFSAPFHFTAKQPQQIQQWAWGSPISRHALGLGADPDRKCIFDAFRAQGTRLAIVFC